MKVAITTQIRENYGSAEKPYWKCKGGEVYIVPDLTPAQVLKIKEGGIPTLMGLLEVRNPMFEETVVDWSILDNGAAVTEPWETPYELRWIGGRWVATRTVENGQYGYMNRNVERKTEEYDMLPGGERGNYRAVYTMRNGDLVNANDVGGYLAAA